MAEPGATATSRPPRRVDLNADLGEEVTDDDALLEVVTSANVACGYHAGTVETMRAVCAASAVRGVTIGAQVSYDDREHFGRVARDVAPDVLAQQVADQVLSLGELARAAGSRVSYVKAHGALYHRVLDDEEQAAALLAGSDRLAVLTMPGRLLELARAAGRRVLLEGFPDRGYDADGRLLPRGEPGAALEDSEAIAAQAVALAPGVDSLCLHGDTLGAVGHARAVRRALLDAGWVLEGLAERLRRPPD